MVPDLASCTVGSGRPQTVGDPGALREHGRGLVDRVGENACALVGSEVIESVVRVAEGCEEHMRHHASEHLLRVQGHVRERSR